MFNSKHIIANLNNYASIFTICNNDVLLLFVMDNGRGNLYPNAPNSLSLSSAETNGGQLVIAAETRRPFMRIAKKLAPVLMRASLIGSGLYAAHEAFVPHDVAVVEQISDHVATTVVTPSTEADIHETSKFDEARDWFNSFDTGEQAALIAAGVFSLFPMLAAAKAAKTFHQTPGSFADRRSASIDEFIDSPHAKRTVLTGMAALATFSTMSFGESRFDTGLYYPIGTVFAALLPVWRELDKMKEKRSAAILGFLGPGIMGAYFGTAIAADLALRGQQEAMLSKLEWPPHVIALAGLGALTINAFNKARHGSRTHERDIIYMLGDTSEGLKAFFLEFELNNLPEAVSKMIDKIGKNLVGEDILEPDGLLDQALEELRQNRQGISEERRRDENAKRLARNKDKARRLDRQSAEHGHQPQSLERLLDENYSLPFDLSVDDLGILVRKDLQVYLDKRRQMVQDARRDLGLPPEAEAPVWIETASHDDASESAEIRIPSSARRKRRRPKHKK